MVQLIKKWKKVRSSLAFRLSVYYSLSGLVIILFLLGFIYLQIMGALHGTHFRQVSAASKRLSSIYEVQGFTGLVKFTERELDSYPIQAPELLFVSNNKGDKILGNIDYIPDDFFTDDYLSEVRVYNNGRQIDARLRRLSFAEGEVYVGRNLEELVSTRALIGRASVITIVLALVLSGLSTYWFLFELRAGAHSIRKTAIQIRAGRFKNRIPVRGQEDEISLLSKELNLMLDHMEKSLNGVKYVSDTIAHNLRTPLMRVLVILRPLEQIDTSPEEMRVGISKAAKEIESLKRLFEKLLYISEIEAGLQRRNFKNIDLADLVLDILDLYAVLAEDQHILLDSQVNKNISVFGDSDLLASALSNIIENAIKYTESKISVSLFTKNDAHLIEVIDNGPGVSKRSLVKLGQHFYRDQSSQEIEGTGLGLTSVMAIMQLHQGNCIFENTEKGFMVRLVFPSSRENHHRD